MIIIKEKFEIGMKLMDEISSSRKFSLKMIKSILKLSAIAES